MAYRHRETLREIMSLAWRKLRWERVTLGRAFSLSEALRHAWVWFKGVAARTLEQAACAASWAAQGNAVTHLRSILRSPLDRSLSTQRYGTTDGYRARYITARLSC